MKYYIVEIEFPFVDKIGSKMRPALLLTKPQTKFGHVLVAFITSKIPNQLEVSDLKIEPSPINQLKIPSVIRLSKIISREISQVTGIIGELSEEDTLQIKTKLQHLFEI